MYNQDLTLAQISTQEIMQIRCHSGYQEWSEYSVLNVGNSPWHSETITLVYVGEGVPCRMMLHSADSEKPHIITAHAGS